MEVNLTLMASNQFGDFTTHTQRIIYINETPNAEFTVDQNLLCSRDSIQFTDHSWVFNGEITDWHWDFGDQMIENDTSPKQHPQYWYAYSGVYNPKLTVMSDSGCINSFVREITLEPSPVNHLFANVEYGCGPQNEILFRDTAYIESGTIDHYQWIFGFNDTVYTEEDSLWHQLNIGEYSVISRVVSELGCIGMDSITGFNVFDKPIARFGFYPDDPSIREPEVFFNDQSIGAEAQILYYHWNFGDNTDTVGLDPVHIYQDTGLFTVLLTIQDANGCVDTLSHTLYVDPVFSFYMPNAFSPNGNGLNDEFGPIGSYFDDTYYEFEIYSRWGEMLFETKDPYEYWKGDFSLTTKNPVPLGVYSWIIRVEDALGEEHVYKGQVTVVR
jgi:gliding motility-associated-like protein